MNDSKDLNVDELLTMLEEMQDQNDNIQEQLEMEKGKNSKAQEMILKLSSENSLLRNTLQQKSEMIVSLNEKIGMLQESDKVLEENLRLRKKNSELQEEIQNILEESKATVGFAKEKYDTLICQLSTREKMISQKETEADRRAKSQDVEITKLADERIQCQMGQMKKKQRSKEAALLRKFQAMRNKYATITFLSITYGILITIFKALKTDTISEDVAAFRNTLIKTLETLWERSVKAGECVALLGDQIPNQIIANVIHWLLFMLTVVLILGGIGALIILPAKAYIAYFKAKRADEITALAVLMDLGVTVFLSDVIKSIVSANLIFVFLVIFAMYSLIRGIFQLERKEERDAVMKYIFLSGCCVVGLVLMIHFFGIAAIIAIPIGMFFENRR